MSLLPLHGLVRVFSRRWLGAVGVGPGGLSGYRIEIKGLPTVLVHVDLSRDRADCHSAHLSV